ncbi:MAG: leucine-rich repeat domain-containing protein, partial [Muribaculaceae bacterium]|nr:leucine-rich repeat domain-containing protein [Muribaculaceae bacterium]
MKKLLFIITFGMFLPMLIPLHARDFTYTYEGQTITYTVLDEEAKTCSTKAGLDNVMYPGNTVSGDLVLPANPKDGDIEYTLTEIGELAFYNNNNLTSIRIPNSILKIGSTAFLYCNNMKKAEFTSLEHLCNIQFDDSWANPLTSTGRLYINGEDVNDVVIPNSVTKIGDFTFNNLLNLKSVVIPNSVKTIGNSAFANCKNMTSIVIPNSVTKIGDRAFYWCFELASVNIPNSVTKIGELAFVECRALTSITIPESVTYIGGRAFLHCANLTKAEFTSLEHLCHIQFEDCYSNPLHYAKHLFINSVEVTEIVIPNSVTEIEDYLFSGGKYLTSITIHNSVTKIGNEAFSGCTGLTSIIIPNSV